MSILVSSHQKIVGMEIKKNGEMKHPSSLPPSLFDNGLKDANDATATHAKQLQEMHNCHISQLLAFACLILILTVISCLLNNICL